MRLTNSLCFVVASLPLAIAYPAFTIPAAGGSYTGGTALTITWKDNGVAPSEADLTTCTVYLYTGSNTAPTQLGSLGSATCSAGTLAVTVTETLGGSTTNAYFIGMIGVGTTGTVTTYSDRFTLTDMTGTFSAAEIAANAAVSGTTGPADVNDVTGTTTAAAAAAATAGDSEYDVPYSLQTGLTKYAPMAPIPGSAITATNTSPLLPTSSYNIATTFLPIPSIVTTLTQSQTFSISSMANTAAAAPQPSDDGSDMAKFLRRWKD